MVLTPTLPEAIFAAIGDAVNGFLTVITDAVSGIIPVFWASETGTLTPVGILLLIGMGVGLVYFAFRLLMKLTRVR